MSELTLLVFRIGFLIALWVFVFFVVFAIRTDLFGVRVKKLPAAKTANEQKSVFLTSAAARPAASAQESARPRSLLITSGANSGTTLVLAGEALSIGRSSDSTIVIRDDYTSTHHARLENRSGVWMLNDLDSTNGTFLDGKRVTTPVELQVGSVVTVGETSFEIRG